MPYLLDTRILLWAAQDSPRLGADTRALLADADSDIAFSVGSIWEVMIKSALGRTDFAVDASALRDGAIRARFGEIPIRVAHVLGLRDLPPHHRDPFDRILLAQARAEGRILLTADAAVLAYGEPARPA